MRSASRAPDPKVAEQRRRYGPLSPTAQAKPGTWQVDFYADGTDRVQVVVDDASGTVRESWTGYQIAWQMARGYTNQFGHKLNAPYVWLPLAAIFLLGLFDFRRWRRIVHLDLLVLLSFGISEIFFNAANIGVSVPLAYPPLVYLLARMIWVGFRGAGGGPSPVGADGLAGDRRAFLLGFRIALNIADSGVIDVGYAGVIGADHITHGQTVWGLTVPLRQPLRRHLRPVQLLRLRPVRARTAVERHLGQPPRRPRRRDLLRPGHGRRPVRARTSAGRRIASASSSASRGPPTRSPTTPSSPTRTTP